MENSGRRLGITEVSAMYGISPRTLRYYEEENILSSHRKDDSRYREYDRTQCERLEVILLLRRLSFTVKEITELLHGGEARFLTLLNEKIASSGKQLLEAKETDNLLKDLMRTLATKPVTELKVDELLGRYIYLTQKTERMVKMNDEAKYWILISYKLIPVAGTTEDDPNTLIGKITRLREELAEESISFPLVRIKDDINLKPYEAVILYEEKELWRDAHQGNDDDLEKFADEIVGRLKQDVLNK